MSVDPAADPGEERDGRSTRWDPHRRERRLTIITAAIDAIEEHGPDASTAQIADRAGVPRTHVYRHFDGKQTLDLAVATHVAIQIGQQIRAGLDSRGSAAAMIASAIDHHLGWIETHPNLYRFLAQHAYAVSGASADAVDAKATLAVELTSLVQRYLRLFGVDPSPAERMIVGVVGLVDATAAWWLDRRSPARAELSAALTAQVWLLLDRNARGLGLTIDPDAPLPDLPS